MGGGSCGEAAQTAKRSPLFADGQLARRRATSIATTATARRLLARSFPILTQLEPTPAPEQARIGPARVVACASQHRRLG